MGGTGWGARGGVWHRVGCGTGWGAGSSVLLDGSSRARSVGVAQRDPPLLLPPLLLLQVLIADLAGEHSVSADGGMDLFSLGVLAWEVMTGKRFYGGEGPGYGMRE